MPQQDCINGNAKYLYKSNLVKNNNNFDIL